MEQEVLARNLVRGKVLALGPVAPGRRSSEESARVRQEAMSLKVAGEHELQAPPAKDAANWSALPTTKTDDIGPGESIEGGIGSDKEPRNHI